MINLRAGEGHGGERSGDKLRDKIHRNVARLDARAVPFCFSRDVEIQQVQITNYELQITNYKMEDINYKLLLQISNNKLQITNYTKYTVRDSSNES